MGVNVLQAFILLITLSYITAQGYVMLDNTDFDLWDADEFLDQNDHVIHKREGTETDLEGSGNGEPEHPVAPLEESLNNKTSNNPENEESPARDKLAEEVPSKNIDNVQISNFRESTNVEAPKSNETKTEPKEQSVPSVESKTDSPNVVKENTAPKNAEPAQPAPIEQVFKKVANDSTNTTEEPATVNKEAPENTTTTQKPDVIKEESKETTETARPTEKTDVVTQETPLVQSVSNKTTTQIAQMSTTQNPPQSTIVPEAGTDSSITPPDSENKEKEGATKVPPQVLPSDLAEDQSNDKKESETVNIQQSGNAVLFKVPKSDGASQVEGSESDKALQGMKENAEIRNQSTELPATGESAKNVSKASKDTTILVVLFVVVIAIGGAAFTHNYIKKRKQNASANNDLVNGIRRSLQNLSSSNGKNSTDVEQGTEMKPLMKDNSPTLTKVYTDSKKEVQA